MTAPSREADHRRPPRSTGSTSRPRRERIWDAITTPEWNRALRLPRPVGVRPAARRRVSASLPERRRRSADRALPDVVVDGEVLEVDPPQQAGADLADAVRPEPRPPSRFTRLTWEIEPLGPEVSRLTVTHELDGAPIHLSLVTGETLQGGGGWPFILSDLKSLLETGTALMSEG